MFKVKIFELYNFVLNIISIKKCGSVDTSSHSLKDSNASPKMKTTEEGVWVRSLACNLSGVKGHVKAPGWD